MPDNKTPVEVAMEAVRAAVAKVPADSRSELADDLAILAAEITIDAAEDVPC